MPHPLSALCAKPRKDRRYLKRHLERVQEPHRELFPEKRQYDVLRKRTEANIETRSAVKHRLRFFRDLAVEKEPLVGIVPSRRGTRDIRRITDNEVIATIHAKRRADAVMGVENVRAAANPLQVVERALD